MSVDLSQFVAAFLEESYEGLEVMESNLLNLDEADDETINTIFRAAHSIKGGAGTFGLDQVASFTHVVETLLDEFRSETMAVTPDLINLLLETVDCIRALLSASQGGQEADQEVIDSVYSRVKAALAGEAGPAAVETESVASPASVNEAGGWKIQFSPHSSLLVNGHRPEAMFEALGSLGELSVKLTSTMMPGLAQINPEECYFSWELTLKTDHAREEIEEIFEWVIDDCDLSIEPVALATSAGAHIWEIKVTPKASLLQSGNDPYFIFEALSQLGSMSTIADLTGVPALSELDPEALAISWEIELTGEVDKSEISELFEWIEDEAKIEIKSVSSSPEMTSEQPSSPATATQAVPAAAATKPAAAAAAAATAAPPVKNTKPQTMETSSIRVETDKIDTLINRVGELVITQAMLGQVGEELSENEAIGALAERLQEGLTQLDRNTRDLQQDVMRVRMQPISFVFNRFPRLVHDVSSKLGKKVELKLSGEQTEIDKTVMEKIGDPMVHLVRNSLDHGLEPPAERLAAGKTASGTLTLKAYHQSGSVVIEIKDDGRGLNTEKIRSKALENGLITEDQVLSDEDINQLIFRPGFSTADAVSDLSGRGVGMDVVRRNIESLGGNVKLVSKAGVGSTFTVTLPLTLAIMDGQLVKLAGATYIIPLTAIIETIQSDSKSLSSIGGESRLLLYRDEYIPLIDLKELFNMRAEKSFSDLIAIVENGAEKLALRVDELLGQQQVVIKSLETNFKRIQGLAGATILGDGGVALILDVSGIEKLSSQQPVRVKDPMNRSSAQAGGQA